MNFLLFHLNFCYSRKCWQSGLALCAILHAYRPELITYDDLDFSDTMNGRKANVNKVRLWLQALFSDFHKLFVLLFYMFSFLGFKVISNLFLKLQAFITAQLLGISDIPDESLILTPDKTEITKLLARFLFYLSFQLYCYCRIKKAVEGVSDLPTPTTGSDHRISLFFPVTDAEKKVL